MEILDMQAMDRNARDPAFSARADRTPLAVAAVALWASVLLPVAASAAPVCQWLGGPDNPTLLSPGPWVYYARVSSGRKCTGYYGNWNGTRIARYRNMALEKAPQHGEVSLHDNASVSYQSKQGYKGPEEFTIEVCGDEGGRRGCTMFNYQVTVD